MNKDIPLTICDVIYAVLVILLKRQQYKFIRCGMLQILTNAKHQMPIAIQMQNVLTLMVALLVTAISDSAKMELIAQIKTFAKIIFNINSVATIRLSLVKDISTRQSKRLVQMNGSKIGRCVLEYKLF